MMMRMTTVTIMMLTAVDCGLDIKEFNFILHIEQSMQSSMSILCVYVNRYTYTFICVHIHIHLKCHVIPATCVCVQCRKETLIGESKEIPNPSHPPTHFLSLSFSLSVSVSSFFFSLLALSQYCFWNNIAEEISISLARTGQRGWSIGQEKNSLQVFFFLTKGSL